MAKQKINQKGEGKKMRSKKKDFIVMLKGSK